VGDVSSDSEIKCFRDAIQRPDAPRALAKEALDMATEVVCGDRQILNAVALCWLANHAALYSPLTRDQSDIVNSARQYFQDGEK
jgi:hypothetical protein